MTEIQKKLQKIALLVRACDFDLSRLLDHGFKMVAPAAQSTCAVIYINSDAGIVVKNSYIFFSNPIPPFAIPTVILEVPEIPNSGDNSFPHVLIQAQAIIKNKVDAVRALRITARVWAKGIGKGIDLHEDNVGWYLGKPVMIDW